jgi:hypothetical protein
MYHQALLSQRALVAAHAIEQKELQLNELSSPDHIPLSEEDSQAFDQLRKQIEDLKVEFARIIHQCLPK